jgi:hypothetical protein
MRMKTLINLESLLIRQSGRSFGSVLFRISADSVVLPNALIPILLGRMKLLPQSIMLLCTKIMMPDW